MTRDTHVVGQAIVSPAMARSPLLAIAIALALTTSACIVGPNYAKPAAPVAPSFKEPLPPNFKEAKGWKQGEPKDDLHRGKWWEIFSDPALNALEEQIDVSNQTLAAAEAQFRQARAAIRVAHSGLYPVVTGGASAIGTGNSGSLTPSSSVGATQYSVLAVPTAGATWTPDLWGQIRRTIESATATAQASAADIENARLSIQGEVALDYFQLRGQDAQKQLLDSTVKAYEEALRLTVHRYDQGVASQVDVVQAQTQLEQTRAQSTDTEVTRQTFEHAIAILIGKPPSDLTIPAPPVPASSAEVAALVAPASASLPAIPGVIPSELLERRPDIAGNERRVAAANAQIGVAISAYYPTLSLGASGGLESSSLLSLFTWPSRFWSLGPSLSETIFDFGRRRGLTEEAQAAYDQTVANYRESVLTAFQNVEDELSTLRILERESGQQADAVRYAERSLELANAQYTGGITTYLQVITAQTFALQNELTAVQLNTRRITASVSLIQALGGGWDVSKLPSGKDVTPAYNGKNTK
jgi:NodT family efflux transporter outer membrane factor (OMF) lipoprotein